MGLIIPKHSAAPGVLLLALEVYVEAGDWVDNNTLIQTLSSKLQSARLEDKQAEPQSYTKKTQVLSYYGFIEWENPADKQSRRKITPSGLAFYYALKDGNQETIDDLLISSLTSNTFGRNVLGCGSDSDVEAPNVYIKASILLNGITNHEFAYIVYNMDVRGEDFSSLVAEIQMKRNLGIDLKLPDDAKKYSDPKPITALKGWNFLTTNDDKRVVVRKDLLEKKWDILCSLRTKNTDKQILPLLKHIDEMRDVDDCQIIFYGAPGTGKSHTINEDTKGKDVIRTTFHPDSDYSTFVGAYKPTMSEVDRYADSGLPVKYQEDKGIHKKGDTIQDREIIYDFVAQAFLKAYIGAWEKYCENPDKPKIQYLIIEEINRGNCAQIFGDLFQLLDRNDKGFSEYPICPDSDMSSYINKKFENIELDDDYVEIINKMYDDDSITTRVIDGEIMLLPSNLYIWATMNTSDQSLFPIDSAFKRRWEWRYVPITEALLKDDEGNVIKDAEGKPEHFDWVIKVGKVEYDWWSFITKVNDEVIYTLTSSEDKKLGYFFCKAKNGVISAETFTNKVIFYLWNEVFKDAPTEELKCLKNDSDKDHPQLTFQSFYTQDEDGKTVINEKSLNTFLTNLGVAIKNGNKTSEEEAQNGRNSHEDN